MDEIADLLRELIHEVQDLKSEIAALRGPTGHDLGDLHADLLVLNETTEAIGGPQGYTIQDVVDRLGNPSIYSLDDIHTELVNIGTTLESNS